ncbi:unnamed protein product [Gongylonema pulchrum]|uniref:KTSC domain-containing protein n=1 Tax=Gongylonema pulchrum TaxID=637853 RepID=A0A183D927_9BILA|nr:unnamed protein product [Gongylonema pulchrum]
MRNSTTTSATRNSTAALAIRNSTMTLVMQNSTATAKRTASTPDKTVLEVKTPTPETTISYYDYDNYGNFLKRFKKRTKVTG